MFKLRMTTTEDSQYETKSFEKWDDATAFLVGSAFFKAANLKKIELLTEDGHLVREADLSWPNLQLFMELNPR